MGCLHRRLGDLANEGQARAQAFARMVGAGAAGQLSEALVDWPACELLVATVPEPRCPLPRVDGGRRRGSQDGRAGAGGSAAHAGGEPQSGGLRRGAAERVTPGAGADRATLPVIRHAARTRRHRGAFGCPLQNPEAGGQVRRTVSAVGGTGARARFVALRGAARRGGGGVGAHGAGTAPGG